VPIADLISEVSASWGCAEGTEVAEAKFLAEYTQDTALMYGYVSEPEPLLRRPTHWAIHLTTISNFLLLTG
jgi:hypothetical protein